MKKPIECSKGECFMMGCKLQQSLEAQVTSLTKERDELEAEINDLNYRAEEDERTIINHEKEMDGLKSLLSKAEEENKERYVFKEDGFDNYEFVNFSDFPKQKAKYLRRFKRENKVYREVTYGSERMVYYTFDGNDCHFLWDEEEALASLKSKGEEE